MTHKQLHPSLGATSWVLVLIRLAESRRGAGWISAIVSMLAAAVLFLSVVVGLGLNVCVSCFNTFLFLLCQHENQMFCFWSLFLFLVWWIIVLWASFVFLLTVRSMFNTLLLNYSWATHSWSPERGEAPAAKHVSFCAPPSFRLSNRVFVTPATSVPLLWWGGVWGSRLGSGLGWRQGRVIMRPACRQANVSLF